MIEAARGGLPILNQQSSRSELVSIINVTTPNEKDRKYPEDTTAGGTARDHH